MECVPCVFHYKDRLLTAVKPLRPGLRFTRAQHDTVALAACDIARRNGWPLDQQWWRTPRLLGHEDLTPISRFDRYGGWDPGYLREKPYFDWDYVYEVIERFQRGRGGATPAASGARAVAVSRGHHLDPEQRSEDESVFDAAHRIFVEPATRIVNELRRWHGIRQEVARLALAEWADWRHGRTIENEAHIRPRLVSYWAAAGVVHQGDDVWRRSWSAAFISRVLLNARVGGHFRYSPLHATYLHRAIRAVAHEQANPVKAYPVAQVQPRVGDVVVSWRTTERTYEDLLAMPNPPGAWPMHGDIVTAVDLAGRRVHVVGGNKAPAGGVCPAGQTGCTVNRTVRHLDANGRLRPLGGNNGWIAVVRIGW